MKKPPYKDILKDLKDEREYTSKYESYIKDNFDSVAYKSEFGKNSDDLYDGPLKKDDFWYKPDGSAPTPSDMEEALNASKRKRQLKAYQGKVGCVITQTGLEGALILSHDGDDTFKIRLQDGTITTGTWDRAWANTSKQDPPGLTSCGWAVGDIKPEIDDEVPF